MSRTVSGPQSPLPFPPACPLPARRRPFVCPPVAEWPPPVAGLPAAETRNVEAGVASYEGNTSAPAVAVGVSRGVVRSLADSDAMVTVRVRGFDGGFVCCLPMALSEPLDALYDEVQRQGHREGAAMESEVRLVLGLRVLARGETLKDCGLCAGVTVEVLLVRSAPCQERIVIVDRTLRIWHIGAGTCERSLDGHSDVVRCATLLPSGYLASGSLDRTVRLWDPATACCLQLFVGHEAAVVALAAVSDKLVADETIASASLDRTVRVWSSSTGECLQVLEGHDGSVQSVVALPDGELASGAADRCLRIWCVRTGDCKRILEGHVGPVRGLAYLDDGRLASASADKTVRLWQPSSGECDAILAEHEGAVFSVAALTDGLLASGSADQTVRIWDPTQVLCLRVLDTHSAAVLCVASICRTLVASASLDRTVRVWSVSTGRCVQVIGGHTGDVVAVIALS